MYISIISRGRPNWSCCSNRRITLTIYRRRLSLEIYRIVQEAVGNSLKHAQATLVKIILVREDNKVKLTVSDNGRGFGATDREDGNWSTIIKERVENLRGTLTLNSAPGKGTELIVEIDLENLEK